MTTVIEDATVSSKGQKETEGYVGEMHALGHEDVLRHF